MSEPIRPSGLEEVMKDVVNVPEPDAEFMNSLRARFIAEGHASAKKNQETQMKQKVFSRRLTWALAILVLISLVVLFTRPTVVNALKRLFGYVPNVGIIDQTSEVLVLTEPITVTRENITVTVEQAVLTNEKTIIVYSYILPTDFFIPDNTSFGDSRSPVLILPDGTRLEPLVGQHLNTMDCPQCSMRYELDFSAIPSDVTGALLELPSLVAVPAELAPQDWKFQLNFKVADTTDIVPVVVQVVTPSTTAIGSEPASPAYGITNTLDKFVALPDGYILYGNISWTDPIIPPYGANAQLASIKDANGAEIPFEYADAEMYPAEGELRQYWAYKLNSTDFVGSLSLSFVVEAALPANEGSFTFAPDSNPQQWQKWDIDQDVLVNNETVHVLSVEYAGEGYFLFTMQSDSNIIGAAITDLAHPPMGGGGGGGGVPVVGDPFGVGFGYQLPLPEGPLTLTFTLVDVLVHGDWTITWNP